MVMMTTVMAVTAGPCSANLWITKCCGVNELLDTAASTCVRASWTPYAFDLPVEGKNINASWLQHWLPPGLSLADIKTVTRYKDHLTSVPHVVPVRSSTVFDHYYVERLLVYPRPDVARFDLGVKRYLPEGGYQNFWNYCVDAALPPFPTPFALLIPQPPCHLGPCVRECCPGKEFLNVLRPHAPSCSDRAPPSDLMALKCLGGTRAVRRFTGGRAPAASVDGWLFTTTACVDTDRKGEMTLQDDGHHFVVECDHPRLARFFYWLGRPLSFAAILLLVAALAAIFSKERVRRSVHGWALASHASCLLAFNITQAAYYISISDQVDVSPLMPEIVEETCLALAFCAYFLLTAAACWLTAICWNLSTGFKTTQVLRSGSERRKFLQLCAFAWGTPIVLTVICLSVRLTRRRSSWQDALWFLPSLLETRTCFREAGIKTSVALGYSRTASKWGTGVYYYGPMAVLCLTNIACVIRTMCKVHFLRRGNAVLKKDAVQGYHGQRETESSQAEEGYGKPRTSSSTSQHKSSATVYVKLILAAGAVELSAEAVAWAASRYSGDHFEMNGFYTFAYLDQSCLYRAVGYCADVLRSVIVLWLAAPDSGDVRALCRRLSPMRAIWRLLIWRHLPPITLL